MCPSGPDLRSTRAIFWRAGGDSVSQAIQFRPDSRLRPAREGEANHALPAISPAFTGPRKKSDGFAKNPLAEVSQYP